MSLLSAYLLGHSGTLESFGSEQFTLAFSIVYKLRPKSIMEGQAGIMTSVLRH